MEQGKQERIEELKAQIADKKTSLIEQNARLLKLLHPDLTDEQCLEGSGMMFEKLMESSMKAQEMIDSLHSCKTSEEIDNWRKTNKI